VQSPFEVLGIDEDAEDEEIVRAYKRRVKEAHPDHGGSADEFQAVRAAYERIRAGATNGDASVRNGTAADVRNDGAGVGARNGAGVRNGADPGRRSAGRDATGRGTAGTEPEQSSCRVEYLNYEVIDDHGWSLGDPDLFEKAADADLGTDDYGKFLATPDETLLEAAENRGFAWPFACRGGACTNCAVAIVEGEMPVPPGHILPEELIEKGIRLACITAPVSEDAKVVYNVKHLPGVDELRLPPNRFERAHSDD